MTVWIIEPRDPLIVRDGRPFGPDPGARARSLPFPFPSTIAGALRHKAGLTASGAFDAERARPEHPDSVLKVGVRGPLLVALNAADQVIECFAPAPADALLLRGDADEAKMQCVRLLPLQPPEGSVYRQPAGREPCLVGPRRAVQAKPSEHAPRFWRWSVFERWLIEPDEGPCAPATLGLSQLPSESRMHVSINPASQTAEEGRLFQTIGLEFTGPERERLALAVESDGVFAHWRGGLAPIGGERRLATWRPQPWTLPRCPDGLRQRIMRERACRLILLTPAFFAQGYRPTELLNEREGVRPQLVAAAVPRPQVVSGWDLRIDRPKPSRRLAAAGSVYFLKLAADSDAAIGRWIDAIWMQNVSDDAQACRDGFGLAALGTWDGQPLPMEVQA
ncbi:type III-B CRISPR module-associated Cmr3 family protein [Kallotenue papyrolyticum]|uniref:type III-B CRISPR module-associated Cmr3 family protein n=1 Tax=Kallotenue papyrolyticum TaxID=1325125 RepID=UPI0004B2ABE2|nr:type III-B CRISPR module-associated protein Cmr3 [Kallotenue papyrolyticum]